MTINETDSYKKTINELNIRYNIILDELTMTEPLYKLNNIVFNDDYNICKQNMLKIQSDFSSLKLNLQNDIIAQSKRIEDGNVQLDALKIKNIKISEKKNGLENSSSASVGSLNDKHTLYNQKLLGNWLLIFSILGMSYKSYKSYKSQ